MMSSICCHSLIESWIIVTGDLLTELVLKCLLYGDKGRGGTIVLRLLSVTFFKHWRPLSHFRHARPFPQLDTAVVESHESLCFGHFMNDKVEV